MQPIDSGLWKPAEEGDSENAIYSIFSTGDPNSATSKDESEIRNTNVIKRGAANVSPGQMVEDQASNRGIIDEPENELSPIQLRKLHVRLGNISVDSLARLPRNDNKAVDFQTVKKALGSCTCDKLNSVLHRPLIHINGASQCGQHIALDIFYPLVRSGTKLPLLAIICMLSRFAVVAMLESHKTSVLCLIQGSIFSEDAGRY